jgi:hypothetical protein
MTSQKTAFFDVIFVRVTFTTRKLSSSALGTPCIFVSSRGTIRCALGIDNQFPRSVIFVCYSSCPNIHFEIEKSKGASVRLVHVPKFLLIFLWLKHCATSRYVPVSRLHEVIEFY